MSSMEPESTPTPEGADQAPSSSGGGTPLARYTIHVPVRDPDQNEIPHVLAAVRQALTDSGFPGRLVVRRAQGDWRDSETEEMDLVMVDAPDTPENRDALQDIAKQVKDLAGTEAAYMTVQQIDTYLV